METNVFVHLDLEGKPLLIGQLWSHLRRGRETASFEYSDQWLSHPDRFALEPALNLGKGPFHSTADLPMFGAIGDSAPDRWGRILMRRAERRRTDLNSETPRTLQEIDYLLGVADEARQGALRFSLVAEGPFLANDKPEIPPLTTLGRLLSAADRFGSETDTDEDLRLLLAPGSSLGGARPKASVRNREGHLSIAKFPARQDEWDMVRFEALSLTLAGQAGIQVSPWSLELVNDQPVLLIQRFDRSSTIRIPFLSAMSMVGAKDNQINSYLEIVDALRQHGAAPQKDMHELWRRIVFNILISNTDDHLRNHGFLFQDGNGWRLSPAYDLNPIPVDVKPRQLSTAIDLDNTTASLELALSVAGYFELDARIARNIAAQVGKAVTGWRGHATTLGIGVIQQNRMASAFEHEDLRASLLF